MLAIQDKSGSSSFQRIVKEYRGNLFKNKLYINFLSGLSTVYLKIRLFAIFLKFTEPKVFADFKKKHFSKLINNEKQKFSSILKLRQNILVKDAN